MKALITGASSGIGRDMARYLSKLGNDVVLVARREDRLKELREELTTNVEIISMDLSIAENCKELFYKVKDVDIVINNAGFGAFGEFTETDLETEIRLIDTNIKALHILTKLYLQEMKRKNRGYILNVASIAGFMPGPLMASYYASKAYVVRLTQGIAEELKRENTKVQISLLCPGPVKTEFNDVANVKFGIKSISSEYVAKYAIDQMLKGKLLIIPGKGIKTLKQLTRFSTEKLSAKISYRKQHRKRDNKI